MNQCLNKSIRKELCSSDASPLALIIPLVQELSTVQKNAMVQLLHTHGPSI